MRPGTRKNGARNPNVNLHLKLENMASSKHNSSSSPCKQINHNSNSSHFVAIFDCFHNMRSNMELCDITLTAGNVSFSAHRLILAGNSPYFRNMFVSENADSRQQEVVLPSNCRGDTLRKVLDYFYSGKLSINQEDCEDLLSLASLLQVCYNFSIKALFCRFCIPKCFFDEYITPDHDCIIAIEKAIENMLRAIGKKSFFPASIFALR